MRGIARLDADLQPDLLGALSGVSLPAMGMADLDDAEITRDAGRVDRRDWADVAAIIEGESFAARAAGVAHALGDDFG